MAHTPTEARQADREQERRDMLQTMKDHEALTAHQSHELELYALNSSEHYPARERIEKAAQHQLDRKGKEAAHAFTVESIRQWINNPAHTYTKEFTDSLIFNDEARDRAAISIAQDIIAEAELGNYR